MRLSIAELKNVRNGDDIWVVATGPSMNFIDPAFFDGKITVGVNRAWRYLTCTYLLGKTPWGLYERHKGQLPDSSIPPYTTESVLVMSEYDCGTLGLSRNDLGVPGYYYQHAQNACAGPIDYTVLETHTALIVSNSTITSAMHFAAHLGAANIIICGHDGGALDGKWRMDDYGDNAPNVADRKLHRVFMRQSKEVRDKLKERYGVQIYTLNPFIGFDLEGHAFDGA